MVVGQRQVTQDGDGKGQDRLRVSDWADCSHPINDPLMTNKKLNPLMSSSFETVMTKFQNPLQNPLINAQP